MQIQVNIYMKILCLTISVVLVQIQSTKQKYTKWEIITKSKKWFTFCP